MLMRLLRLAIMAPFILLLPSCQTSSRASPSEIKEAVKPLDDQRVALLIEFCRGQKPQQITAAEYDSWPDGAKAYVVANAQQWIAQCDA